LTSCSAPYIAIDSISSAGAAQIHQFNDNTYVFSAESPLSTDEPKTWQLDTTTGQATQIAETPLLSLMRGYGEPISHAGRGYWIERSHSGDSSITVYDSSTELITEVPDPAGIELQVIDSLLLGERIYLSGAWRSRDSDSSDGSRPGEPASLWSYHTQTGEFAEHPIDFNEGKAALIAFMHVIGTKLYFASKTGGLIYELIEYDTSSGDWRFVPSYTAAPWETVESSAIYGEHAANGKLYFQLREPPYDASNVPLTYHLFEYDPASGVTKDLTPNSEVPVDWSYGIRSDDSALYWQAVEFKNPDTEPEFAELLHRYDFASGVITSYDLDHLSWRQGGGWQIVNGQVVLLNSFLAGEENALDKRDVFVLNPSTNQMQTFNLWPNSHSYLYNMRAFNKNIYFSGEKPLDDPTGQSATNYDLWHLNLGC